MGPFVCNAQGNLEKIDFSNAGLQCKRFPPAFGQFPALETLMLRYNSFNGDSFSNVAKVGWRALIGAVQPPVQGSRGQQPAP